MSAKRSKATHSCHKYFIFIVAIVACDLWLGFSFDAGTCTGAIVSNQGSSCEPTNLKPVLYSRHGIERRHAWAIKFDCERVVENSFGLLQLTKLAFHVST